LHYAETLKAWRARFMARRDEAVALYDERFARMWEFYLASCEACFRWDGLFVFQIQLAKRLDAVPVTRDYIFETEQAMTEAEEKCFRDPHKEPARVDPPRPEIVRQTEVARQDDAAAQSNNIKQDVKQVG
jgi:cyclopropane-fatty-acyl-phospholipid synthase